MIGALALLLACGGPTDAPVDDPPGSGSTATATTATTADRPPGSTSLPLRERCFGELDDGAILVDYEPFGPVVASHCKGTDHQDIAQVGKVVYLGDSITAGTPPTHPDEYYTALVTQGLVERFGSVEVADCSEWGARIDDLMRDGSQVLDCFAAVESEPVLVVFTVGGNDMVAWGQDLASGVPEATVEAEFEAYMQLLRDTLQWFRDEEPTRFPAGVNVVFANVYEYTDGTNDVASCPIASVFGVPEGIEAFREGYVAINEAYMQAAVDTQTDVLFLFEHFCGHGFHHDDPANPCYRGPDAERWFDDTCIHPTPAGHAELAAMVLAVVDE